MGAYGAVGDALTGCGLQSVQLGAVGAVGLGLLGALRGGQPGPLLGGCGRLGPAGGSIPGAVQRVVRLQDGHIIEDRPNVPDEGRALNANV